MIVNAILTALQLLLIEDIPSSLGLSNFWFALGDDAAAEFVNGIQFLVSAILMTSLSNPLLCVDWITMSSTLDSLLSCSFVHQSFVLVVANQPRKTTLAKRNDIRCLVSRRK